MATRSRTTFQKRQKEIARKEKRRLKAERLAQRRPAAVNPEGASQGGRAPLEAEPGIHNLPSGFNKP